MTGVIKTTTAPAATATARPWRARAAWAASFLGFPIGGLAGIAVVGYLFLGESLDWVKAGAIGLIILGVVVLNSTGTH